MKNLKVALVAACAVVVGWAFTASADGGTPAYEFLEYASTPGGTGSPRINTEVVPATTMEFRFKYAMDENNGYRGVFGSYAAEDTQSTRIICNSGNTKQVLVYFMSTAGGGGTVMSMATGVGEVIEGCLNLTSAKLNAVSATLKRAVGKACTVPMHVFAAGPTSAGAKSRFWYFSILDNGVYTHHYLPCRRTADGVVGLWDVVGKSFVEPTGGALTASAAVQSGYRIAANDVCQFGVVATAKGKGTVSVNDGEAGSTASTWSNVLSDDKTSFPSLTATVTATADEGWRFICWKGDVEGLTAAEKVSPQLTVTTDKPLSLTAVFVFDLPASAYVQDGLVAQFDGIENAGVGTHAASASVWKNLKGDEDLSIVNSVSVGGDCMTISRGTTMGYLSGTSEVFLRALKDRKFTVQLSVKTDANYKQDGYAAYLHFGAEGTKRWLLLDIGDQNTYTFGRLQYRATAWDNSFAVKTANNYSDRVTATLVESGDGVRLLVGDTLLHTVAGKGTTPTTAAYLVGRYGGNKSLPGEYQALRLYNRVLTAGEIAVNANIDKMRFEGADSAELNWPDRYRFVDGKIQCLMSVSTDFIGAKVSLNDGTPATEVSGWFDEGTSVTVTFIPGKAGRFARWEGLPDGATEDATQTTITIAAGAYALTTGHHTVTWNKLADNSKAYWDDAENWTCEDGLSRVPQEEDVVVIPGSAHPRATTYLTNSTPQLKSITIGARRTLSVSGWNTRLWAGEIEVQGAGLWYGQDSKGYISCGSYGNTASNRINILTDMLKINVDAAITASGYTKACGPGWDGLASKSGPGSHGGMGFSTNCRTYGSITEPCMPGTGPSSTTYGCGGGVISITSGVVIVNGSISASGAGEVYGGSAGSGGSLFIKCDTIEGAGTVSANGGGNVNTSYRSESSPGGGGRVAVHYDPELQSNVVCGVAFRAIGGCDWGWGSTATRYEKVASCGTVYLSDDQLIRCAAPRLGGKIYYGPEVTYFTDIGGEDVDISDCLFEIDTDNFVFAATNSMTLSGTSAREFGVRLTGTNATVLVGEDLVVNGASVRIMNGGNLIVGRDLIHVPAASDVAGGEIYVSANPTNGTEAAACGGTVAVGRDWIVGEHCGVFTCCNADSGSIVKMFAGTFELDNNSYLGGDRTGWGMEKGFGAQTTHANGSNHGGYGGVWSGEKRSGKLYGKKKLPLYPGSGTKGASGYAGLPGGGVVYLKTSGRMTINGKVSVAGTPSVAYTSGTAGGSVFLNCGGKLCGTNGVVSANGGNGLNQSAQYSAGGGGRTAIWYRSCSDDMAILQEAKGGKRGGEDEPTMKWGEDGTTYWHQIPGLMLFVR